MGLNPVLTRLLVVNASVYIKIYKHHENYIKNSKTFTETAKTEYFTNKVNFIEWYHTLINFLHAIPVSSGILLSYIYRLINVIIRATYRYFIDEYVDRAPLTGQAYQTYAA